MFIYKIPFLNQGIFSQDEGAGELRADSSEDYEGENMIPMVKTVSLTLMGPCILYLRFRY